MNKQKNKKKVIAFLLSMLMLISLFQNISYTPIAEGGETESVASESDAQGQAAEPYDAQSVSETGEADGVAFYDRPKSRHGLIQAEFPLFIRRSI